MQRAALRIKEAGRQVVPVPAGGGGRVTRLKWRGLHGTASVLRFDEKSKGTQYIQSQRLMRDDPASLDPRRHTSPEPPPHLGPSDTALHARPAVTLPTSTLSSRLVSAGIHYVHLIKK